jgi:hypothetical protein
MTTKKQYDARKAGIERSKCHALDAKLVRDTAALLESFHNAGIPIKHADCDRRVYLLDLFTGERVSMPKRREVVLLSERLRRDIMRRHRRLNELKASLRTPVHAKATT